MSKIGLLSQKELTVITTKVPKKEKRHLWAAGQVLLESLRFYSYTSNSLTTFGWKNNPLGELSYLSINES